MCVIRIFNTVYSNIALALCSPNAHSSQAMLSRPCLHFLFFYFNVLSLIWFQYGRQWDVNNNVLSLHLYTAPLSPPPDSNLIFRCFSHSFDCSWLLLFLPVFFWTTSTSVCCCDWIRLILCAHLNNVYIYTHSSPWRLHYECAKYIVRTLRCESICVRITMKQSIESLYHGNCYFCSRMLSTSACVHTNVSSVCFCCEKDPNEFI